MVPAAFPCLPSVLGRYRLFLHPLGTLTELAAGLHSMAFVLGLRKVPVPFPWIPFVLHRHHICCIRSFLAVDLHSMAFDLGLRMVPVPFLFVPLILCLNIVGVLLLHMKHMRTEERMRE